jgi:hypothetical protein
MDVRAECGYLQPGKHLTERSQDAHKRSSLPISLLPSPWSSIMHRDPLFRSHFSFSPALPEAATLSALQMNPYGLNVGDGFLPSPILIKRGDLQKSRIGGSGGGLSTKRAT